MTLEVTLKARSKGACELCGAATNLSVFAVPPAAAETEDMCALLCETCRGQVEGTAEMDVHHWHCLSESMWSEVPAVRILAWRILTKLQAEPWCRDLLDMLYLDEDTLAVAQALDKTGSVDDQAIHRDSNGAVLASGDTVTLIKDLNVKGAGFTAKRGTAVRNISLVADNPAQIEGRVNGQQIVILTEFVKKST